MYGREGSSGIVCRSCVDIDENKINKLKKGVSPIL